MSQQNLFGKEPSLALNTRQYDKQTSRSQHTWFFALRPSVKDLQRIHTLTENLLVSSGVKGKRISPERLHITLALIGHDLDEHIVDQACRAAETVHFPSLEAHFDSLVDVFRPQRAGGPRGYRRPARSA